MDSKIALVAADGARARHITVEVDDLDLEENSWPRPDDDDDDDDVVEPLVEPLSRERERARLSGKPSVGGPSGAGPVADDQRDRHALEDERLHAQRVVSRLRRLASEQRLRQLVAAAPRSLGALRERLDAALASDLQLGRRG